MQRTLPKKSYERGALHQAGSRSTVGGSTDATSSAYGATALSGQLTNPVQKSTEFEKKLVSEYRTDDASAGLGDDPAKAARRLQAHGASKTWTKDGKAFSLDEPTNRDNEGLNMGDGSQYNPEIYRLSNEKTKLIVGGADVDVNYKQEIVERCGHFLQQMETASTGALSSVRQWLSETEKIRDIARSNCLAGQKRQASHEKKRRAAIQDVTDAATELNGKIDNLKSAQEGWCNARDAEVAALIKEYDGIKNKITIDEDYNDATTVSSIENEKVAAQKGKKTLNTFYVDPTKRSWNLLCDVIKFCKKSTSGKPTDYNREVRVARGASLALGKTADAGVNAKMGIIAGAFDNLWGLPACHPDADANKESKNPKGANCLNGYLKKRDGANWASTWGSDAKDCEVKGPSCSTSLTCGSCDVYQVVPCSSITGVINFQAQTDDYVAGDSTVRDAVETAVCDGSHDCNGLDNCNKEFPVTRREEIVQHCSTYSDSFIEAKRKQFRSLTTSGQEIVNAAAATYSNFFAGSQETMQGMRNTEWLKLRQLKTKQQEYVAAYLTHAEALRKANEENQFFMEMVMEAEMMRLAYDQFQHTVTTAQVAAQMTYTKDEKDLFQAHQVGAEFGATCNSFGTGCVTVPGIQAGDEKAKQILRKSAMYSTTNKWFGLAQQNLEALLFNTPDVAKACCSGKKTFSECKLGKENDVATCKGKHTSPSTEFQPSQQSIAGEKCVCALLANAYPAAVRVRAERRAAIQLLKYLSDSTTETVDKFCTDQKWCNQNTLNNN